MNIDKINTKCDYDDRSFVSGHNVFLFFSFSLGAPADLKKSDPAFYTKADSCNLNTSPFLLGADEFQPVLFIGKLLALTVHFIRVITKLLE